MNNLSRPGIRLVLSIGLLAFASGRAASRAAPATSDFALQNLEGKVVRLSSFRGHTVVLDFWAAWCPPCVAQVPWMRRLTEKYKSQGVIVLDINVLDERKVVQNFISEHGHFGSDVLLTLTDESTVTAFGVEQFPSTIIVDGRGRIVATFSGGAEEDFAKIDATVRRLASASGSRRKANG